MDHQVSPEPENVQSEEEEEEEASDLENGSKGEVGKHCSSPAKLFTFSVVNSYGTANISPLPCDGNILKLNRKCLPVKGKKLWFLTSQSRFVFTRLFYLLSLQHIPQWRSTGTLTLKNSAMMNRKQRSVE